ncbi:Nucleoside-diphosphate-sugar epimerase [Chitinophaga sp. YR627]|uniref:SDR family oxidoreductase n=1 Tax=Chitinophaga sp. YR627 TaxID=1881041 RepID=UPI0008F0F156|nr:SDR family oxidoreductase [Chitinophaga sp. YR627]SFO45017.1 Nucleoside-diphosphate-sugar epimerase [Chitinophaga sp. YR627]
MKVFVTGASGFIGSAVVQELIAAGHQVTGLARSEASAKALEAAGAAVHYGSLEDLDSLKQGAAASDGVIHLAFIHDFSKYKENCETDRLAIEALSAGLEGTDRPLIITSGTGVIAPGRLVTEADLSAVGSAAIPRVASEEAAAAAVARGVKASIVRLPPSVHGDGDRGFIPGLIAIAREKGVAAYVEDGANRWPAVHRLDAAKVFRLALEKGNGRPVFHAVGDEGVSVKELAGVISRKLSLPLQSVSKDDAAAHFGWLGMFVSLNIPASAIQTAEWLGWKPEHVGLVADLENGTYF